MNLSLFIDESVLRCMAAIALGVLGFGALMWAVGRAERRGEDS